MLCLQLLLEEQKGKPRTAVTMDAGSPTLSDGGCGRLWSQGQTGAFAHAKVQKALVTHPGSGVHVQRLHMEPKQQRVWTARHPLKLAEMYCVCMCVSTCVCGSVSTLQVRRERTNHQMVIFLSRDFLGHALTAPS